MKKKLFSVFLSIVMVLNIFSYFKVHADNDKGSDTDEWNLVWQDEFEGNEINFDNWSFDHPENGRYNGEIQSYTDKNAWVENGHLIIEARKESVTEANGETYEYTSSKLITQNKQSWTYGKFEIRAKMPEGQGMWPAIWMMPEDEPFYGTWPVGGEIDIMEMLGHEPDTVYANIHYGQPKGENQGIYKLGEGKTFSDDFHIYTLEWEPGEIRWYIDGELYNVANDWHSKHNDNAAEYTYPAPFDQPFFLILNISVGGNWPGNPDESTELPQQMVVDYVRVYQKDEYPQREKPAPAPIDERPPLEDGNLVYNGSFSSGKEYWTFLEALGGKANYETKDEMLHVLIDNGGEVDYSVQLIQDSIPLKKGAKYRAIFEAKSEKEREVKVKLGGGASRGYKEYSNIPRIVVNNEWNTYEFDFTMNDMTDLQARFEFNMGLDDSDVWLRNIKLFMIEDPKEDDYTPRSPLPTGNYVYNGTFDQGKGRMAFWEFIIKDGADGDFYIGSALNERRFESRIKNGGKSFDSVQLVQDRINLEKDKSYELTFSAQAESIRDMQVRLVTSNSVVLFEEIVELTESTEEYVLQFDIKDPTNNDVTLEFNIGGNNHNVYIDDVFLSRILDSDGIENNLIKNGIFDSLQHWITEMNHAKAKFMVDENDRFKVNITDPGDDTWTIQLYQYGVELENGGRYQLKFDAKSSIPRPILLNIEHKSDYTKYFTERILLDETMTTYNYEFTMKLETDADAKFGFSFGSDGSNEIPKDEHDIYIDNVVLIKMDEDLDTEIPDTEKPDIENPDIEKPDTERPDIENPDIEKPDTERPDIEKPDIDKPELPLKDPEKQPTKQELSEDDNLEIPSDGKLEIKSGKEKASNATILPTTGVFDLRIISGVLIASGILLKFRKKN